MAARKSSEASSATSQNERLRTFQRGGATTRTRSHSQPCTRWEGEGELLEGRLGGGWYELLSLEGGMGGVSDGCICRCGWRHGRGEWWRNGGCIHLSVEGAGIAELSAPLQVCFMHASIELDAAGLVRDPPCACNAYSHCCLIYLHCKRLVLVQGQECVHHWSVLLCAACNHWHLARSNR